jgi:membrane protease YdiL (CAAX protease family)
MIGAMLLLAALLLAMRMLAARMVAVHLLHEAQRQSATLRNGQPLWQWQLRQPHDLVAGRVFGNASIKADGQGLDITSVDGTPFELGLPIDRSVDLAHWPLLQLQATASAAARLDVLRRTAPDAPLCTAASAGVPGAGVESLTIDLRQLDWIASDGGRCSALAQTWLLRLRVHLPQGDHLYLRSAALLSPQVIALPRHPDHVLSEKAGFPVAGIRTTAAVPWFELPTGASAENMLAWRDRLRSSWPAALVVPAGFDPEAAAPAAWPEGWSWAACMVYLAILLASAARPLQGTVRPWFEAAACMAGPLWLIAGLQWKPHPALPPVVALGAALLYAIVVSRRDQLLLHENPGITRGWLLPLLPLLPAVALLAGLGQHPAGPSIAHILTYLAWAGLQQWLMLAIVLPKLQQGLVQQGLGGSSSIAPWPACLFVAVLFALLHTPNGALMQLCLLVECWWAWCYVRSGRLLPIVLAHAACALVVEAGLLGVLTRSLEVSARFFL